MGKSAAYKIYMEATSQCLDLSEQNFFSCSDYCSENSSKDQAYGDKTCDLYLSTFHGIQCIAQQLMLASTL
jgi:hypothetical protein